jgi:HTH-type transcriptional regulator, sugar sensing transcriptional regulator
MATFGRSVDELTRLGLTTYEARAYVALLGRGSFTAAQVARQSSVPRQRIYDVLASLVERGLSTSRPGRVVHYAAVAPDQALERLLDAHRRQLQEMELSAAETISELSPAFEAGRRQTDPLDYIEVLRDAGAIGERFAELQASVQREILVFTKPPYAIPPQENVEGLKLTGRHVARSVYELSVLDGDPEVVEGIRRFIESGEEARFVESLPLKLVIIDESIVMFGMQDPVASEGRDGGSDLTIMVVEHPSLATVLKDAFEATWARGLTLDAATQAGRRSTT